MASLQRLPFPALLKRLRRNAGLTQEQLAEQSGYSAAYISMLERGQRTPTAATLDLLAETLGLSSSEHAALRTVALGQRRRVPAATTAMAPRLSHLPLVGRLSERARLDAFLHSDAPPLLVVAGEPGIGKSRLLHEAAEQGERVGWQVLRGACYRRAGEMPYAPVLDAIAGYIRSQSASALRRTLAGCAWLVRLLPELAEAQVVPAPSWTLPPAQERRLMFGAARRFLANIARPAGTLLVLDDLQWAGDDALDLLASLLRTCDAPQPLRVVAAARDTEPRRSDALAAMITDLAREELAAMVFLDPLAPVEAAELLDVVLAGDAVADALDTEQEHARQRLLRRSGGVPFYIISLVQSARAGRLLGDSRPREDEAVPWDVAESIRQRAAALPPTAQEALSVPAVLGQAADVALLAHVTGAAEPALLAALEVTCAARLLAETADGEYTIAHELIREVIAADIGVARRAMIFRRAAEALESAGSPAVELLADYFEQARDWDRAVVYLERAADRAAALHANIEAERGYQRLVEWLDALGRTRAAARVHEKLADILTVASRYDAALRELDAASAEYRRSDDREALAQVLAQIGRIHARRGTLQEGVHLLHGFVASDDAAGLSVASLAALHIGLARLYEAQGQPSKMLESSQLGAQLATAAGEPALVVQSEVRRASALCLLGRLDEALQASEAVIPLAEAAGDLGSLSTALNVLAEGHLLRGELASSKSYVERACQVAKQRGDDELLAFMWLNRGDIVYYSGDWRRAREDYERAMAVFARHDASWYTAYAQIGLGLLYTVEGAEALGSRYLEQSIALAERSDDRQALRWAQCVGAERDLMAGQPREAYDRLWPLFERDSIEREMRMVSALLVWAMCELDDEAVAEELSLRSIARMRDAGDRILLVDALRAHALLRRRQRRYDEAAAALEEALALARAMASPYAEAKSLYVYGLVLADKDKLEAALADFTAALALCDRLGEGLYRPHIAHSLAELQ
jgi:transcriptional regulator with XRE-family HTH domain/tetratricopeptide (TPR) repeat protein